MRQYSHLVRVLVSVLMLSLPAVASALGMVITGDQMTKMMQPFLPYKMAFNGMSLALNNPVPTFAPETQHLAMTFDMAVREGNQTMNALAKIGGQLQYDPVAQQLQLVKPELLDFKVKDGQIKQFDPLVKQLQANLGMQLPIIVLVDGKTLGPGIALFKPSSISVVRDGISFDF